MVSLIVEKCMTTVLVLLCFIGLFGNLAVLVATANNKELHRKICYLVAVLTSLHVVCLLCELYLEALGLRFHAIPRSSCFLHTFAYTFAMHAQSVMFFMLSLDILFALSIPMSKSTAPQRNEDENENATNLWNDLILRHNVFPTSPYVICMCLPPLVIASIIILVIFAGMNDSIIEFCTPIKTIPRRVVWISYMVNGLNVGALILNMIAIRAVKVRYKDPVVRGSMSNSFTPSAEIKLIRSFIVLGWVFVCSWCLTALGSIITKNLSEQFARPYEMYSVMFALPTYCQCFFVSYLCSDCYKSAYRKQYQGILHWISTKKSGDQICTDVQSPNLTNKDPLMVCKYLANTHSAR